MKLLHSIIGCYVVSSALAALASDGPSIQSGSESNKTWTADDAVFSDEVWGSGPDNWQISPDSRRAVWVKSQPDKDKGEYVGNLFLSDLMDGREIQLTRGADGCGNPKWSPDGERIAFLSSRSDSKAKAEVKGKNQIWLINPFGGEPWVLTSSDRDVAGFDWAGTNEIIYAAKEEPSAEEKLRTDEKDNSQVVEDDEHEPPVRLFKVDVTSAKVTPLTTNTDRIEAFSVSPDGNQVVTWHEHSLRNVYDLSERPVIFLTDMKTGTHKQLYDDPQIHLFHPITWERDSRGFYAVNPRSDNPKYSYPSIFELYHYDLAKGELEKVNLDWERGLSSWTDLAVTAKGFITLLADGVRVKAARYTRVDGEWRREWITGDHASHIFGLALGNDDKTMVYRYSTPTCPTQYYKAVLNGARIESPKQLTHLNPPFQEKPKAKCETVHWKGALGETVEGLLFYPLNYQAGKKYPVVVDIHGGPAWHYTEQWWDYPLYFDNNILNERGAFVFRPNYHGSAGYGLSWIESNIGRLGELEVEDINTGVDYLVNRGFANPERLAVMGWSNGGALTAAVCVQTNRYCAAIAGDGQIDYLDYWSQSDIGASFCGSYLGKSLVDDPLALMRFSPSYQLKNVTTPTLILFGSDDKRVPVEQGWIYYRSLQQSGKAKVRFVIFPGEHHGPAKFVYLKRAYEEELAWLDKYLFQEAAEPAVVAEH